MKARVMYPKIYTKQDKLHSDLRSYGETEFRRRWSDAERRGILKKDPHRALFLADVQKTADEAKPARMKWIRENLGEREAQFRQGLADEASAYLRMLHGRDPSYSNFREARCSKCHRTLDPKTIRKGSGKRYAGVCHICKRTSYFNLKHGPTELDRVLRMDGRDPRRAPKKTASKRRTTKARRKPKKKGFFARLFS